MLRNISHMCIYKPHEQITLKRYADFVKPLLHKILPPCMEFMIVILTSDRHYEHMDDYMKNANISLLFLVILHD
jgi:hypothetical protein